MISIGDEIKAELQKQERGVTWLAKQLGCSRMAIYRMLDKNSLDTALLVQICKALKRDFFKELSEDLNFNSDTRVI